jgi:hypothetical protein
MMTTYIWWNKPVPYAGISSAALALDRLMMLSLVGSWDLLFEGSDKYFVILCNRKVHRLVIDSQYIALLKSALPYAIF